MTPALSALLFILFLLGLVALNIPIGVALIVVSFFGISTVLGFDVAATFIANIPREVLASWELSAIPMFLLMGSVALYGGLTDSLFRAARLWLGWLPGGLAIATNFSAAGLGAATGSSMATAVAMGRISIPEMRRSNYDVGLAAATCASAGTLAALIPPSIPLIVYGMLAEQSLVKLFAAGVVPGIITALIYAAMILLRAIITPSIAPRSYEPASWHTRFLVLLEVWPLPLLVVLVFGGLYGGFVGPTEAGAFGAALAIIIAFFKGGLSFKTLRTCLQEACRTTAIILFVAIGAVMFARYVALIGLPDLITDYLTAGAISHLTLILVTVAVYLVLGMFLDPMGVMLLSLPIFLPLYDAMGFNLIWFGVIVVKFIEIGLLTPPLGMNVFAIRSILPDVSLSTIYRGVAWFLLAEILVMALLLSLPILTLWLPNQIP